MSFPRYPKYKDSGVKWLRQVPEHWNVGPVKRLIDKLESGTSVNATDEIAEPEEFGVLKTSCVYTGYFRPNENKRVLPEERHRVSCPLREAAIVVSRMNTPDLIGAAGLVTQAPQNLYLPDRLWQVVLRDSEPSYVYYWTLTNSYRDQVKASCTGTSSSMKNLSQEYFSSFQLPLPPLPEQRAIASFLDRETAKIDALVAEQRRLIELLKEKRQAVISHAVTKGLNPDAPMKDSGIKWLGMVPEHWEVKKVKHLASRISSGKTPLGGSEVYVDQGIIFLRSQNVYDEGLRLDDVVFIAAEVDEAMAVSRVIPNDILLNITGASLGRTCVVPHSLPSANVNQHVCVIRLHRTAQVPFVGWLFKSASIKHQIDNAQSGAARDGLNFAQIGQIGLALPPDEEQQHIASFLDGEILSLGALTAEAESAIDLLQERRTALISAAVTGKIDVRRLAQREVA